MKEIILHIGGERTGTSSFQKFMTINAARIDARDGVIYPLSPVLHHYSNHKLLVPPFIETAADDFVPAGLASSRAGLTAELASICRDAHDKRLLLSSEHFSSRFGPASIAAFKAMLDMAAPGVPVRILYASRDQASLYGSLRQSHALALGITWFSVDDINPQDPIFNHLLSLSNWAEVFGWSSIEAFRYESEQTIDTLCDMIGIATDGLEAIKSLNGSLTEEGFQIMDAINRFFDGPDYANRNLYESRIEFTLNLARYFRRFLPRGTPLLGELTEQHWNSFIEKFERSNQELVSRFGSDLDLNAILLAAEARRRSETTTVNAATLDMWRQETRFWQAALDKCRRKNLSPFESDGMLWRRLHLRRFGRQIGLVR